MSTEVVEKPKAKRVKSKTAIRKKYKLADFVGCFKGHFFYDDVILI